MRAWSLVVLYLAPLTVVGAQGPPPPVQEPPPDRIESGQPDRPEPVWVSAERAVREGQELDLDLFTPFDRSQLQRRIEIYRQGRQAERVDSSTDPCLGTRGIFADYYVPDPTIEDLVRYSAVVFSGTVQGGKEGIHRGQPSRLYRVRVEQVWKDHGSLQPGGDVFLTFPDAQIRLGEDWLCARSPRFPDRPHPGKRVLVFSHQDPLGAQPIFSPMEVELFFETRTSLSVPGHLTTELTSPNLADIEDQVSRWVQGEGER